MGREFESALRGDSYYGITPERAHLAEDELDQVGLAAGEPLLTNPTTGIAGCCAAAAATPAAPKRDEFAPFQLIE